MHKKHASDFDKTVRQSVAAGSTVVGLAHVNKRRGNDDKAIHAGTADILDDLDSGYMPDELTMTGNPGERFVDLTRLKGRGGGSQSVAYAYALKTRPAFVH